VTTYTYEISEDLVVSITRNSENGAELVTVQPMLEGQAGFSSLEEAEAFAVSHVEGLKSVDSMRSEEPAPEIIEDAEIVEEETNA
jgi:hypothetical protein